MIGALKTGDKVVTTGGIHGIISNVKDGSTLLLKVDDGCKLEVDKSAIATIKKD
jgi:preprotein translocase subunit YajC